MTLWIAEQGPQGIPGPPGSIEDDVPQARRVDFIGTSVVYKGEAAVGTLSSVPAWRIKKLTLAVDDDVTEEWAGGTAVYDKVWDDRMSYSYS